MDIKHNVENVDNINNITMFPGNNFDLCIVIIERRSRIGDDIYYPIKIKTNNIIKLWKISHIFNNAQITNFIKQYAFSK